MSTLDTLYTQVPLEDATSEIRLLTVLAATNRNTTIECHLSAVRLTSPGDYEGLSYHWWGDADQTILVNGLKVDIRRNLFNALKSLRLVNRPRVLWVDAICINQASDGPDGEKPKQLPLMRDIYQQSIRTVAWFGLEAVGDGGTHNLAGFIERLLRSKGKLEVERPEVGSANAAYIPKQEEWTRHGIPSAKEIGYRTLVHLFTRSWTERAWVIQEVAVAREVLIQCGPYTFPMQDVAEAMLFTWTIAIDAARTVGTHFKSIWAECVKQKLRQRGTLLSLVIRHWLSDATYPHDKIYALCGLSCDAGPDGLDIRFHYQESADEVYISFARSVLTTYRNLDIFSVLSTSKPALRSKGLPSWVPDWNRECFISGTVICRRPDPMPDPGPCRVVFTTAKGTVSSPRFSNARASLTHIYQQERPLPPLTTLASNGRCLTLDGYILDDIAEMGQVRPTNFSNDTIIRLLIDWRNKVAQCASRDNKHYKITDQPTVEAFYHTMTMGNVRGFLQNPLEEYHTFDDNLMALAEKWNIIPKKKGLLQKLGLKKQKPSDVVPSMIHKSSVFSASGMSVNRRLVRTRGDYLGLVPMHSRASDKIALFRGGAMPMVIRERRDGQWEMVGDAYVHGVMMGEVYEDSLCREFSFV
ncbi:heterokaryon incompatibility protein-domain-containing protein [Podospora didyma]|uniref:Heterokaryon incompatibility protein-domain-containing protein n=1 Tax=Podospora didyma TaxID=330526 RepID=A0AAE0K2B8_9PEZI|nr:heterokaryon incompatibility protein-domain-containing protein [Podospora didyma]